MVQNTAATAHDCQPTRRSSKDGRAGFRLVIVVPVRVVQVEEQEQGPVAEVLDHVFLRLGQHPGEKSLPSANRFRLFGTQPQVELRADFQSFFE